MGTQLLQPVPMQVSDAKRTAKLYFVHFMMLMCRGTYIDSVSVIFLVISLGLAVDYSVHVAHGYLSTREADPELRLQKTMAVRFTASVRYLFLAQYLNTVTA